MHDFTMFINLKIRSLKTCRLRQAESRLFSLQKALLLQALAAVLRIPKLIICRAGSRKLQLQAAIIYELGAADVDYWLRHCIIQFDELLEILRSKMLSTYVTAQLLLLTLLIR